MTNPRKLVLFAKRAAAIVMPPRRAVLLAEEGEMLLCQWRGGKVSAIHVTRNGGVTELDCSSRDSLTASLGDHRPGPVIVILPKSEYLVKNIETPQVPPEEIYGMLRLEVESSLPPEFGDAEISYFRMSADTAKEGRLRHEVYVTRDQSLRQLSEATRAIGLHPDLILPSAVAWRGVLASQGAADMLVVELPGGETEVAIPQAGGGCHVRTIENPVGQRQSSLPHGVLESIRSLLAEANDGPRTVLWCGPGRPSRDMGSMVHFASVQAGDSVELHDGGARALHLAWRGISQLGDDVLQMCGLKARGEEVRRQQHVVSHRLTIGALAFLAGLLLIQGSLWILIERCRGASAELDKRVTSIRREGETAESRLKQLQAVAVADSKRDDFQRLLGALYDFTPEGISYSEITMENSGEVRLHGQARSMGAPFLLPSALEGKWPLEHVVIKAAGLSKTGGGTITEFKAELTLKRENAR